MESRLNVGDIVSHFKRGLGNYEEKNKYLYVIESIGLDCSSESVVVVYRPLYNLGDDAEYSVFVREYSEFMSRVDKDKYPDATQEYIFEECDDYDKEDFVYSDNTLSPASKLFECCLVASGILVLVHILSSLLRKLGSLVYI